MQKLISMLYLLINSTQLTMNFDNEFFSLKIKKLYSSRFIRYIYFIVSLLDHHFSHIFFKFNRIDNTHNSEY